jgi:PAS domain S-box-containing protein
MPQATRPRRLVGRPTRWTAALLISMAWMAVVALAVAKLRQGDGILVAIAGLGAGLVTFGICAWHERTRWRVPVDELTQVARSLRQDRKPGQALTLPPTPELAELTRQIAALSRNQRPRTLGQPPAKAVPGATSPGQLSRRSSSSIVQSPAQATAGRTAPAPPPPPPSTASMTRSGLYDAPPETDGQSNPNMSGDFSTIDMVNRLEPVRFHWNESSPAEQEFLGWNLAELRQKSFLDIVLPDDRPRAEQTLREALERGESLGLIVRVRTASGKTRAVEVNVGARYGRSSTIDHLRCHLTDVSDKVRAERELKLRTQELTQVNEQLRKINRELEELKDRYTDLYENSPAMYFNLDTQGKVIECNQTMLTTLQLSRQELLGQSYDLLLDRSRAEGFLARYQAFMAHGSVEKETVWVKPNGELIDVWAIGKVVAGSKGSATHTQFVAQDITLNRLLEAELQEKNRRLGEANVELSQRNRELDEFVYGVSHDLQEPLRTLISFSDFLMKDYGDRLETDGKEYVRYLVDASRRMRAMIHGLLTLSRAGKVIGEFAMVDLGELTAVIKADLGELLRSRNAELRVKSPLPEVWGDRDRIGQLLANLIANAVKYNQSSKPWVEVEANIDTGADSPDHAHEDHVDPHIVIAIKDNGIGIEPEFHKTIFQLFRRLHPHDEYEGTGVGLAICNKIVQAHGGRIWVESTPGEGSTFFIRLRSGPTLASSSPSLVPGVMPSLHENSVSQVSTDEPPTI